MADFSDWINKRYIEWRGNEIGRGVSVSAFARLVGVSQQVMNHWMTGGTPVDRHTIDKLVNYFGTEVLDVLGYATSGYSEPYTVVVNELAELIEQLSFDKSYVITPRGRNGRGVIFEIRERK